MDFASWKDRKVLAGVLKTIYRAKDADAARAALEAFDASQWGAKISRHRAELAPELDG